MANQFSAAFHVPVSDCAKVTLAIGIHPYLIRIVKAQFANQQNLYLEDKRLTVCVSGFWAGWENV
jgi:hypothetical protein